MNELVLLGLDYLILSNFVLQKSTLSKPHSQKIFVLALSAVLLISAHIAYFILTKEANIFEKHNSLRYDYDMSKDIQNERVLSYLQLNDFPEDRNEAEIYVLNNTVLRTIYDKCGDDVFTHTFADVKSLKTYVYEKVTFETFAFYIVAIMLMQYAARKENIKGIKKWMACLLAFSFLFELNIFVDETYEKDWVDNYFPYTSIFERIAFMRVILVAIINIVRVGYKLLYKNKKRTMEEMHKVMCSHNKKLLNYFESSKSESDAGTRAQLKDIDSNLGKIGVYLQTELEFLESKTKNLGLPKALAIISVLCVVLYNFPTVKQTVLSYMTSAYQPK